MAERPQPHQVQVHPRYEGGFKGPQGPSASRVLALVTMLAVGGGHLALSGITLAGTLVFLAVIIPLFSLCSTVLVQAALVIGFAVTAFLASRAFGLTGLTALSSVLSYLRQAMPEQLDQAKERMQDMAGHFGQKTKEAGQEIQSKAYEGKRRKLQASVFSVQHLKVVV